MKTMRMFGLALAAVTLSFSLISCGGDDDDENVPPASDSTSTSTLGTIVTVSGAQLCRGSMPCTAASSVSLSAPSTVNSGSSLTLTSSAEVSAFYLSLSGKDGYYKIPVSYTASATRATGNHTYVIVVSVSGSENVTVAVSAQATDGTLTPSVSVIVIPVGGSTSSDDSKTSGKTPSGVVAVDLGLPSGTKWGNMNIGAFTVEDYGDYFAWGETVPYGQNDKSNLSNYSYAGNYTKTYYDWSTLKYCSGTTNEGPFTKYCIDSSYGTVDNKTSLDVSDDAAYVNWGSDWRMPTYDQMMELKSECTWIWTTTENDINGYRVTGPSGNSIFLPAAGYRGYNTIGCTNCNGLYWSRTLHSNYPCYAYGIYYASGIISMSGLERYCGHSIRPVRAAEN